MSAFCTDARRQQMSPLISRNAHNVLYSRLLPDASEIHQFLNIFLGPIDRVTVT